ncbi:MAG TPA: CDP-alcohol phosphatidyltransferase family protein [Candidatus Limnocylindria bacterium]|nr:CDP-alcohol phosphatidyltransferase family protein [Candidatus Limnocylindria bacterium]
MTRKKPGILNVPNALTMLRMALIPLFVWLMARGSMMESLAVFLAASFTDVLDGWIARRYNLITDFGKVMDPLADKLMVLSAMLMLALKGVAPWAAIIVLLLKEALMVLGGLLLLRRKVVVYSMPIGKAAQFVTVVALALSFFHESFARLGFPLHLYMLWLGVGLAVVAFFYYARRNFAGFFRRGDIARD